MLLKNKALSLIGLLHQMCILLNLPYLANFAKIKTLGDISTVQLE